MESKIIAVDYDQTIRAGNFPFVYHDLGAIPILKRLIEKGHKIILWTLRSNRIDKTENCLGLEPMNGTYLDEAVEYLIQNGVELYGINEHPYQKQLTDSPKVWADLFLDDRSLNFPTIVDKSISEEPFADWKKIEELLIEKGLL